MSISERPLIMGVLNVTPDSFSDGGLFLDRKKAIERGLEMVDQGADWIDVGGESTRPGAEEVSAEEEMARVLPVIEGLYRSGAKVSIDTSKGSVARSAIRAGASFVNDVTAWSDPNMGSVCAESGVEVCLMHMQGTPRTMQANPHYDDVVSEVRTDLEVRASLAVNVGIPKEKVWLDPGIGFGKTVAHNLELLANLDVLVATGYPILIGVSRKSFIWRLLAKNADALPFGERLPGTLAAQILAQSKGARMIRCHDVLEGRQAADLAAEILRKQR